MQRPDRTTRQLTLTLIYHSFCIKTAPYTTVNIHDAKAPFTLKINFEINFESEFRNLEHVLFCEVSPKIFRLWSAMIGQSASVYKHRTKRRLHRRCWLSKVYFQCEKCSLSKEKFGIFSFELISNVKEAKKLTHVLKS